MTVPTPNWFCPQAVSFSRVQHNVIGMCCKHRLWLLRISPRAGVFPELVGVVADARNPKAKALAVDFAPQSWHPLNECAVLYKDGGVVLWDLDRFTAVAQLKPRHVSAFDLSLIHI